VLGATVRKIRKDGDVLWVEGSSSPHAAAHVVLALPTPPLRSIEFSPGLPASLQAAINGLDLGDGSKVLTEYRSPFWRDAGWSGFSVSDLDYRVSWDATDSYDANQGIITTFTTGRASARLSALSSDDRIRKVQLQLAATDPRTATEMTGRSASIAWSNEPLTGGAYAAFRPGQLHRMWTPLRTGTDQIHLAGEHTEVLAGYMESAVRSGHRIAQRIGKAPR
jgi:monoamine oxidase